MDVAIAQVGPPAGPSVRRMIADQRPTADAAALARSKHPDLPLGPGFNPASQSQAGAVSEAMLQDEVLASVSLSRVAEPERVLKPYGVTMLPHSEARARARAAEEERKKDEASAQEAAARASASEAEALAAADAVEEAEASASIGPEVDAETAAATPPDPETEGLPL